MLFQRRRKSARFVVDLDARQDRKFQGVQKRDGMMSPVWLQAYDHRSRLSQPVRRLDDGDPRLCDEPEDLESLKGV